MYLTRSELGLNWERALSAPSESINRAPSQPPIECNRPSTAARAPRRRARRPGAARTQRLVVSVCREGASSCRERSGPGEAEAAK
ncbi:hypothetical protein EVAR_50830_1 [Eumeta japonica]|uniref:Uncharacterized protein n=1 Tax=Eumeta variegata TaxID=151549 RepID=A0A4C1XD42_EUMVA|nr:hypothetical protein EVAR_50830_1 [Eumeta japonica]